MSGQAERADGRTELTMVGSDDDAADGSPIAILSDTENERAWIQSDVTVPIEE